MHQCRAEQTPVTRPTRSMSPASQYGNTCCTGVLGFSAMPTCMPASRTCSKQCHVHVIRHSHWHRAMLEYAAILCNC